MNQQLRLGPKPPVRRQTSKKLHRWNGIKLRRQAQETARQECFNRWWTERCSKQFRLPPGEFVEGEDYLGPEERPTFVTLKGLYAMYCRELPIDGWRLPRFANKVREMLPDSEKQRLNTRFRSMIAYRVNPDREPVKHDE